MFLMHIEQQNNQTQSIISIIILHQFTCFYLRQYQRNWITFSTTSGYRSNLSSAQASIIITKMIIVHEFIMASVRPTHLLSIVTFYLEMLENNCNADFIVPFSIQGCTIFFLCLRITSL